MLVVMQGPTNQKRPKDASSSSRAHEIDYNTSDDAHAADESWMPSDPSDGANDLFWDAPETPFLSAKGYRQNFRRALKALKAESGPADRATPAIDTHTKARLDTAIAAHARARNARDHATTAYPTPAHAPTDHRRKPTKLFRKPADYIRLACFAMLVASSIVPSE